MKKVNVIKGLAGLAVMAAAFVITVFPVCAAEGKVIAKTAKIRASASTDSAVVASTSQGKTIDIQGAVNDGAGVKWYQVPIAGGGFGYIRADLVETSETIEVSSNAGSTQPAQSNVKPEATVPTSIGEQQAVIKSSQNVRVRTGASTQHDTVTSLPNGTPVTIIGEANDSAGKKWYQITCSYNGRNIEGYVRWDLVEIGGTPAAGGEGAGGDGSQEGEGENPEVPEGENPEGEGEEPFEGDEAPEPEHNDYEVVYDLDQDSGEYEYYLYMNLEGNKVKVNDLLNSVNASRENMQKLQDQVDKEKIIIIILAAVIVLLFIVITVLLFKIRGLYYDDDEEDEEDEDEEEEEEEEPAPVRRKVRKRVVEEEEETPVPVKRKRPPTSGENPRPARPSQDRSGQPRAKGEKELHAAERKEPARKAASRKPQNFLMDDDEFEFEFLNMDDKDI